VESELLALLAVLSHESVAISPILNVPPVPIAPGDVKVD
jgi:hypothetical protein